MGQVDYLKRDERGEEEVRPHLQIEMFQTVVFEVCRVWSGTVRLALLATGVQHMSHPPQLEVGGLLHGVVVADLDVPDVEDNGIHDFYPPVSQSVPVNLVRPRLPPVQVCGSLGLADGQLLLVGIRLEGNFKEIYC